MKPAWLPVAMIISLVVSGAHPEIVRADFRDVGPSLVRFEGRQLLIQERRLNGSLAAERPFVIRGVNWSPASRETASALEARRAEFSRWVQTDASSMQSMNVNTVRLYLDPGLDTDGVEVLDELYRHGLHVILTVDQGIHDLDRLRRVVTFYRDHPAILLWMVGSEWNINLYFGAPGCDTPLRAARCTQRAAQVIQNLDSNHPVATSYGDIDIEADGLRLEDTRRYVQEIATSVDVWALNIFRGADFGGLFRQWESMTEKPMFLGEFGTDAIQGDGFLVDETMQAHWDLCLWNDLVVELSTGLGRGPAIGGLIFEWNDEWWKVPPPASHDGGGFRAPGAHPDDFAHEEYFGIVDIDRQPRDVFSVLGPVFRNDYEPPPRGLIVGTVSRGTSAGEFPGQLGIARFYRCGKEFYDESGGGGGGRGFNVVALDPSSGDTLLPPENFDTFGTRRRCARNEPESEMFRLVEYLEAIPEGSLVMLSVADDAGLNRDDSCQRFSDSRCYQEGFQALEALGSELIGSYCFRDSWAMIAVQGEHRARKEGLVSGSPVSLLLGLPDNARCRTTATALCLTNRFLVGLEWETSNGTSNVGQAIQLTEDTGYFWFFDENNVEVVVKALDACPVNDRFWVFATGLTNVGVTLTVEDTVTGREQVYRNAAGRAFQPVQDVQAFATCP